MSTTVNWHCDLCNSHWDKQRFPPAELLGIGENRKICEPGSEKVYKHICRKCAVAIAESVKDASTTTLNFAKMNTYYTQEAIDARLEGEGQ
jgi:hypothetical protein